MHLNRIYSLLKSLNLTIFLLICIALMIAISSLQSIYPSLLKSIGLYNIYYSFYFKLIIILFMLNLIICTIDLISKTKKLFEVYNAPGNLVRFFNTLFLKSDKI